MKTTLKNTTTDKPLSLIDCDIHNTVHDGQEIVSRMPAGLVATKSGGPGAAGYNNPFGVLRRDAIPPGGGAPGSDPAYMAKHHFDKFGIDYGILLGGSRNVGVSADYRFAAAYCSAYNDYLIEYWLKADPRFLGAMLIAPQWPQEAAKEVRRVGSHPRIVQTQSCSAARIPFGNVFYWPIYEAACEVGIPVSVHPGAEGNGISGPPSAAGYGSSYFEWHTNLSQNYMAHITSLVAEGVFEKFPTLTFIGIEGGVAWLPHLMWRMDKNWKSLRSTTPWLKKKPSEYIIDHVKLTTQPIEEPDNPKQLLQIFEMMHAEKTLLFSSDYPHWDNDSPAHSFPKMDQDMHDRIFYKNAAELYGIEEQNTIRNREGAEE